MLSILICSYEESPYLKDCLFSIKNTVEVEYEVLVDVEPSRTGISNTPKRYHELFKKSKFPYIAKVDDDVWFWRYWFEEAKELVDTDIYSYVGIMDHTFLEEKLRNYAQLPYYYHNRVKREFTHISGVCWVFKRDLWEIAPYEDISGKYLDSAYGNYSYKKTGKRPTYTDSILCNHMGIHRRLGKDLCRK